MIDCPSCGKEKDFVKEGKYICSSCNTKFTVDENGKTGIYVKFLPIVTISFIVICTAIFALTYNISDNAIMQFGIIPQEGYTKTYYDLEKLNLEGLKDRSFIKTTEVESPRSTTIYRALTYLFLHGNYIHLFFNMIILYFFGSVIEQKMKSTKYLLFLLFTGYFSGIIIAFVTGNPTIGASGAVFGLLIAFAWFYPHQELRFRLFMELPSKIMIPILIGVEVLLLFANSDDGISHEGHLAGVLISILFLTTFFNNERRLFKPRQE